eukprot:PITA_20322
MYFDGSKTQDGLGAGCALIDPYNRKHMVSSRLEFECTNNVAEYEALMLGLQKDIDVNVVMLKVVGDSEIVILHFMANTNVFKDAVIDDDEHERSLKVEASNRKGHLITKGVATLEKIYELQEHFQGPRNNKTHSSTMRHEPINLGTEHNPKFVNLDVRQYLEHDTIPSHISIRQKWELRLKALAYQLVHKVLYKKHSNGVSLKCPEVHESEKVLQDLHDRPIGGHFTGNTTTHKVMQASFYWPTLFKDAHAYARKCPVYQ